MLTVEWQGSELGLMPQKCVYRSATRTLMIGDAHFGKAAAFRAAGIPVPLGTTDADLARLDEALDRTDAARLVVLGDLLHARSGRTDEVLGALSAWRTRRRELEVVLVRGNHDRHAGDPPDELAMRCVAAPLDDDGLLLHHEPPERPDGPAIAAHVHPTVLLRGRTDRMRLPCFVLGPELLLVPAFGSFTGGHRVRPGPDEHVFAVTPEGVVEVTAAARVARGRIGRKAARPRPAS
ncbi:MAG: ligase-associated DNA damage response endonuclease PdeM [Planctomycetota bacterium]|jgi:DNA ligase-associated metallophosphoesterase